MSDGETGQEAITDGDDERLYAAGFLCAHSSDDSGVADVGITVGLGGDQMIWAGELPKAVIGKNRAGLCLYGINGKDSPLVAESVDYEAATEMVEAIAGAICRVTGASRNLIDALGSIYHGDDSSDGMAGDIAYAAIQKFQSETGLKFTTENWNAELDEAGKAGGNG